RDELSSRGALVDAVYYCPHEKQPACTCRKPAPGMLLQAAREQNIDLTASWMVGDSEIDIEAGKNAGCKTVRLLVAEERFDSMPDLTADSLREAVDQILRWDKVSVQRT